MYTHIYRPETPVFLPPKNQLPLFEAKVRACFDCLSGADVVISRDAFRATRIDERQGPRKWLYKTL